MTWVLPPQPSKTQRARHWCRAPLQSQVLKGGSCRTPRHFLTYGFPVTAAVAPAGREEQYGSYVGVDEGYHRRETIAAAAAAAAAVYHRRETSVAAAAAAATAVYHRRETSVAAAAATTVCHSRGASAAAAAAAAKACYHREIPYGHPFVGLRLPRPPRLENHDRRQEHGGAMDVPGTGGE